MFVRQPRYINPLMNIDPVRLSLATYWHACVSCCLHRLVPIQAAIIVDAHWSVSLVDYCQQLLPCCCPPTRIYTVTGVRCYCMLAVAMYKGRLCMCGSFIHHMHVE
jgi:hypothetical protein